MFLKTLHNDQKRLVDEFGSSLLESSLQGRLKAEEYLCFREMGA